MAITNTANFDYMYRENSYNQNASNTIEIETLPVVTMEKKANTESAYPGDIVTYFVTIILGDFQGQLTNQVFSDAIPTGLEFVDGSLTVDAVPTAGTPENIEVMWQPNSEHLIIYQCIVL